MVQQGETDAADSVYQAVYKRLRKGKSFKQVEAELVEAGFDLGTASLIVQKVAEAQKAAKTGALGYRIWIKHVIENPFRSGFLVGLLTIITIPVAMVAGVARLLLFPAGTYPRIVLAVPGIIAGLLFFLIFSFPIYLLYRVSG
jgi:hypothetical protein